MSQLSSARHSSSAEQRPTEKDWLVGAQEAHIGGMASAKRRLAAGALMKVNHKSSLYELVKEEDRLAAVRAVGESAGVYGGNEEVLLEKKLKLVKGWLAEKQRPPPP